MPNTVALSAAFAIRMRTRIAEIHEHRLRTEYDRYAVGEAVVIAVHAMTVAPVRLEREVEVVTRKGEVVRAQLEGGDGCITVPESSRHVVLLGVHGAVGARIVLRTCEPRIERTPEQIETNPVDVR